MNAVNGLLRKCVLTSRILHKDLGVLASPQKCIHWSLMKNSWLRWFPRRIGRHPNYSYSCWGSGGSWCLSANLLSNPEPTIYSIDSTQSLSSLPELNQQEKFYLARKLCTGKFCDFVRPIPMLPLRKIVLYELILLTTLAPFATMNNNQAESWHFHGTVLLSAI